MEHIKTECLPFSQSIIDCVSSIQDINSFWKLFSYGCQKIIQDEVPSRQSSQRFDQHWINRKIRKSTRLKKTVYSDEPNDQMTPTTGQNSRKRKEPPKDCADQHMTST
ncbi:hypothetical protein DPMN_008743 [Dreissena polymorpha]|uniref:Uncharacterized protein n=1 Tax=Dreissena polymorpha TaxID=45954 RepID=A0A9D4N123_DREPO|nr:hypothetical protein DPMN_008743 [Dreissena polymorpha]